MLMLSFVSVWYSPTLQWIHVFAANPEILELFLLLSVLYLVVAETAVNWCLFNFFNLKKIKRICL